MFDLISKETIDHKLSVEWRRQDGLIRPWLVDRLNPDDILLLSVKEAAQLRKESSIDSTREIRYVVGRS